MTRGLAGGLAILGVLATAGAADLRAQRPEFTQLRITEVPDFSGFWQIAPIGRDFDQRVACAGLKDPSGAPMARCSLPWEAKGGATLGLKDVLNKRGLAWMEFRDEQMSEKHLCIPNTLPAIQDRYIGSVFQLGAGEIHRSEEHLNSSHGYISYAVFCLKKKKKRYSISELQRPTSH